MRAKRLVFSAVRRVEWESFDLPEPLGPSEILVQARYSLISPGTELAIYTGSHIGFQMPNPPFPLIPNRPGYALVGTVEGTGAEAEEAGFGKGQRVLVEAPHGTHAVVDVRKNLPVRLPEGLPDQTAPLVRMAKVGITALRVTPPSAGEGVLVLGMGLVGNLCGQLYRIAGARPVVGTDRVPQRLELARRCGILPLEGIDPNRKEAYTQALRGLLCGGAPSNGGPGIVVEATGSPALLSLALEQVGEGGKVVLLGSTRGTVQLDVYSLIHRKGVCLVGAHERVQELGLPLTGGWNRKANQEFLASLFARGEIQTEGLITHRISPSDAPSIYEKLAESGDSFLGVLIDWG